MRPEEIEITLDEAKQLMGREFSFFETITRENVFCHHCYVEKGPGGMNIRQIYLSPLNDIIAKGTCVECGKPVGRYMETGENPDFYERANKFRKRKR